MDRKAGDPWMRDRGLHYHTARSVNTTCTPLLNSKGVTRMGWGRSPACSGFTSYPKTLVCSAPKAFIMRSKQINPTFSPEGDITFTTLDSKQSYTLFTRSRYLHLSRLLYIQTYLKWEPRIKAFGFSSNKMCRNVKDPWTQLSPNLYFFKSRNFFISGMWWDVLNVLLKNKQTNKINGKTGDPNKSRVGFLNLTNAPY